MIGEYLSAIIEDNNTGEYTHYGKLKKLENVEDAGGTIEIDLDKMGGMAEDANKTLYLFNEQCNEDYETDYASDLKEVNVEKNAYAITNTLTKLTTTNKTTYRMMSDKTSPYEAQLTADNGHVLLETITVKVGGKELDAEDYTYKKGKLIIPAEQITGDLEIKAEGSTGKLCAFRDRRADFL